MFGNGLSPYGKACQAFVVKLVKGLMRGRIWQTCCIGNDLSMDADLAGMSRPLIHILLARGERAEPGLWTVEYLLSTHSFKSITAAT